MNQALKAAKKVIREFVRDNWSDEKLARLIDYQACLVNDESDDAIRQRVFSAILRAEMRRRDRLAAERRAEQAFLELMQAEPLVATLTGRFA